jgi:hypothetical protein
MKQVGVNLNESYILIMNYIFGIVDRKIYQLRTKNLMEVVQTNWRQQQEKYKWNVDVDFGLFQMLD